MPTIDPGPYLTKFQHKQEGLSGGADDSDPPTSGFNALVDDICRTTQIGTRLEGEDLVVTATSYPGSPDFRFPLTPWVGKFLVVQALMERTGSAGTFSLDVRVEGPPGTEDDVFVLTRTGAIARTIGTVDLTTFAGVDRRGMDGWLNFYMKVSGAGVVGTLKGLSAFQAEDDTGNTYLLW